MRLIRNSSKYKLVLRRPDNLKNYTVCVEVCTCSVAAQNKITAVWRLRRTIYQSYIMFILFIQTLFPVDVGLVDLQTASIRIEITSGDFFLRPLYPLC